MMTDAAVCVTENIHRWRYELNKDLDQAVTLGTREVAGPVISSNLTQVAVFLPLLFAGGLIGELFRDFSLTVAVSQLISIVVALTLYIIWW